MQASGWARLRCVRRLSFLSASRDAYERRYGYKRRRDPNDQGGCLATDVCSVYLRTSRQARRLVGGRSSMTRSRLRVGVVGQGFISRAHTHAFMQLRQLEVAAEVQPVVLCGHDPRRAEQNADRW